MSLRVYPASTGSQGGPDEHIGMILKKPKSAFTEIFTDAVALDVSFPNDATTDQKGLLTGVAIFLNSVFFEGED